MANHPNRAKRMVMEDEPSPRLQSCLTDCLKPAYVRVTFHNSNGPFTIMFCHDHALAWLYWLASKKSKV